MAQAFDPARLELSGEAFPVAESVGVDGFSRGSFSVSETGVVVHSPATEAAGGQLTWFDRAGKTLGTVGSPAGHLQPSLSPDEKRVADDRLESGPGSDIWIHELARSASTRFTFDPANDVTPVWSPDGSRIAFASNREGAFNLYQKPASGAGKDELLLKTNALKFPTSWSRDGRFLAYTEINPKTRQDLWVLPLEGDRKPAPFLQGEFNEALPHFSPDGRWIAYTSDESGTQQVYAQPFPATGAKWQISTTGGYWSTWRRDGKEIYYLSPDRKLMAVDVKAGATFEAGVPRLLFQTRVTGTNPRFAVTGDGQRFLMSVAQEEAAWTPATVVINWTAGIKR